MLGAVHLVLPPAGIHPYNLPLGTLFRRVDSRACHALHRAALNGLLSAWKSAKIGLDGKPGRARAILQFKIRVGSSTVEQLPFNSKHGVSYRFTQFLISCFQRRNDDFSISVKRLEMPGKVLPCRKPL